MGKFFHTKIFLPASISLLAVAIIVASLTSSGLIKGINKEKQLAEVKGETISVTKSPTPTMTPIPTIVLKKKLQVETYITPTLIPTVEPTNTPIPTPTAQPTTPQSPYANFQDKQAYCREVAAQVVLKIANDPEIRKDLQWVQGELGSAGIKYLNDSAYTNAYQTCISNMPQ